MQTNTWPGHKHTDVDMHPHKNSAETTEKLVSPVLVNCMLSNKFIHFYKLISLKAYTACVFFYHHVGILNNAKIVTFWRYNTFTSQTIYTYQTTSPQFNKVTHTRKIIVTRYNYNVISQNDNSVYCIANCNLTCKNSYV